MATNQLRRVGLNQQDNERNWTAKIQYTHLRTKGHGCPVKSICNVPTNHHWDTAVAVLLLCGLVTSIGRLGIVSQRSKAQILIGAAHFLHRTATFGDSYRMNHPGAQLGKARARVFI